MASRLAPRAAAFLVLVVTASAVGGWLVRERLATPPAPTEPPAADEGARLKRGRLLYQTTCRNCHGDEGRGDGDAVARMNPPPRDFAEGPWKFGTSPDAVRKVIRDGVPGTAMPASPSLGDADLDALTAYVLTLAPESGRLSRRLRERIKAAGFTPIDPPREAPPLEVVDRDDRPVSLSEFRGSVVMVNVWGTECAHCLAEMPELERLAEALAPRDGWPGLVVLPVCADETDREPVINVAGQHAPRLKVFVDPSGLARVRFDAQVLPSTFLIDARGRLVGSAVGRHKWSREALEPLLTP
jgi:mono/diheme cytochrome c family protein/thiol-disulfide isomerase/thioredoxin